MVWPFTRANPAGYVNDDVPTHSEINLMDQQIAQAADGAWWTDAARFANFPYKFTHTFGGKCGFYNPVLGRFFSFNVAVSAVDTNCVNSKSPFYVFTTAGIASITPNDCAVDPTTGKMIVVGTPISSSQSRIRSSTDGITWTARTSAKAASTAGPVSCLWAGGTINKFFIGFLGSGASGEIESSPDGVTWTNQTVPSVLSRTFPAFSPSLNRILWISGSSAAGVTSDDGVNWTARTLPTVLAEAFWSVPHGKFFAFDSVAPSMYSSADGITWSSPIPLTGFLPGALIADGMFAEGRVMGAVIAGNLVLTVDEWATTVKVAEVPATFLAYSDKGQLLCGESAAGIHMAAMRFGF